MRSSLLAAVLAGALGAADAGAQAPALTIERLAAQPSLAGTAPSRPEWSHDGRRLAFLWNDRGLPFLDVWVVEAAGGAPRRVTDMGRDHPYPDREDPDPNAALAQQVARRARTGVSEVVWTPDGQSLVLAYRGDLYRVRADGAGLERLGLRSAPRHSLAFSRDGRYLAYLQDGDLWLWNQRTNENVQVTRVGVAPLGTVPGARYLQPDVEFSSFRWSPDGRYVALEFDDRSRVRKVAIPNYLGEETHVNWLRRDFPGDNDHVRAMGIYDLAEGRVRMVELPDRTDRRISNYDWSPDSRRLLVDQNSESAIHRWLYVVDPRTASPTELWHDSRDNRTTQLWNSAWLSDSTGVVFIADFDDMHHLYSIPVGGGKPAPLTSGAWSVISSRGFGGAQLSVSPAGDIFFVSTRKNPYERHVYTVPQRGGEVAQVTTLAGTHVPYLSPDGSRIAVLHSSDVTPTELYLVDAKGGGERRITTSPPREAAAIRWIQPRYVTFKSHVDGTTLHGRLLEPPGLDRTKKYPVIVGPIYANTVRNEWRGLYHMLQQYLAMEGQYIGLHVDVRGSSGHGREHRDRLLLGYGGIDIDDLQSGVEYLKTLPYVDADRIGIWGSSYGGLMTVMSLFKKPGVYKAGVAGAPATNVWHATTGEVHVARRPDAAPESYRGSSAINFGADLRDPLMIIHGMQDDVVLFKDSVTLVEKLMMLGKDFDFVVAPSAVHGWAQKDYAAVYLLRKLVQHFDRHLGRGPRPVRGS